MKKLLAVVAIAGFMSACNDEKKTESTVTSIDSTTNLTGPSGDTSSKMMDIKLADTSKMMDKMAVTTKM
jgi:hypothetical protein